MNNLKVIRTSKGLSQFDLAKIANISPADLSRIENNKIFVYPNWRKRISEALKIPENEIFPDEKAV